MLDRPYRIKANIHEDNVLNVNLNQDFNILEVLSLKIGTEGLYKLHTSNYGCVAGRVLANGGFGIPNAKISIFISASEEDLEDDIISYLYPYKATSTKNEKKVRYNLLPEEQLNNCHRNVGSFPSKRMVLDDDNVLEVFDKYYKFTTRTNNAGDYIIFGVPTGNQTIHIDIDLSDIGVLSQKPRDMIYKGYNITQFENANMFKKSTDIDNLAQIITQNQNVYVYPFWGEESEGEIAISRKDIDIQYEFTPTCVFMGSLITDERSNGISKRCIPSERMGKMDKLTTGKGTIEMIRKTINGDIEECIIQGNQLVDGNGVWCYQIPMNLDYVRTDEYGNMVPTDDTTKGIPTRASVRFRISLTEFETENEYSHLSKVLVPNNPKQKDTNDYAFGSKTNDESFRDLFWNDVYTVKSYIPRLQMANLDRNKRFSGIKAVNVNNSNNPIPYNNMRVDLTFMFSLQCAIFKILLWIVGTINRISSVIAGIGISCNGSKVGDKFIEKGGRCVYVGDGYCQNMEGWYFAPKCKNKALRENTFKYLLNASEEKELYDSESNDYQNRNEEEHKCLTNNIKYFVQCVELTFAMEYDVVQFDFYNDWINGMIYMPRWFADIRKKKSFLFGLVTVKPKINACMENAKFWFQRRYVQQCALEYDLSTDANKVTTPLGCKNNNSQRCHKSYGRKFKKLFKKGGLVHNEKISTGEYAYYFKPCEWVSNGGEDVKCNLFATDIVLLGSLDENNSQGVPQAFKKLVATSYQMPDPLASTNLGEEGYVYTGEKESGTLCSEDKNYEEQNISRQEPTFENVANWSTYQLNGETKDELYDEKEYAVTEAAGIDWGYIGPNQKTDEANDIKKGIYFPGGHFLGISCGQSETNIKSCVNLSRICEMGTLISQRQSIVRRTPDGSYTYSYLIPTGLISGDEINDYGFKNEFATMNYNGLRTKLNPKTNLLEYDFETITPINFNGELNGISGMEKSGYNELSGINDNETKRGTQPSDSDDYNSWAYRRTIEENSNDYYKFRLDIHPNEKEKGKQKTYLDYKKEKYLNVEGNKASLPMYGNSFYFYFGLKNGNTALDNFYKDFFAECPEIKEYDPSVTVTSTNCGFCEDSGTITVQIKNIERASVRIPKLNIATEISGNTYEVEAKEGEYVVYVGGENMDEDFDTTVVIERSKPKIFQQLEYEATDYKAEVEILDTDSDDCGTVKYTSSIFSEDTNNVCALVLYTDLGDDVNYKPRKEYAYVVYNGLNSSGASAAKKLIDAKAYGGKYVVRNEETCNSEQNASKINLWVGNHYYNIEIYYSCDGGVNMYSENIRRFYINMPKEPELYFYDIFAATYRNLVMPMLDDSEKDREYVLKNWYDIFLRGDTNDVRYNKIVARFNKLYGADADYRLEKAKGDVRYTLFYQNPRSILENANGKIDLGIIYYGVGELFVDGSSEKIEGKILNISNTHQEDYASPSLDNFVSPTQDAPNSTLYYLYDYTVKGDEKEPYRIRIKTENGSIPGDYEFLTIPSIYRPFFFRALYVTNYTTKMTKFQIAIANGLRNITFTENIIGKKNITTSVGEEYGGRIPEVDPKNFESYYKTGRYFSDMNMRTDGVYEITATDWYGKKISKDIKVTFIGDIVDGHRSIFRTYDVKVRYYCIPEGEISLMNLLDASLTNEEGYIQYNESYWGAKVASGNTTPIWNDALSSYIRSRYKEIPPDKIWQRYIDIIPDDNVVVGVYDSNIEYSNYQPIFDDEITIKSNGVEPRHENSISLIRLYESKEFKELIMIDD